MMMVNLSSTFDNITSVNMRASLVFFVATLVLGNSHAGTWLRVQNWNENGPWLAETNYVQQEEDNRGYSSGNGLASIAHGSANRAYSAASNQYAAAQQASYIAQNSLAQEAFQAAATAHAALAGKAAVYKGLEKQVEDAQDALESEVRQLRMAESTARAAKEVADAADEQINSLEETLKTARSAAEQARSAADDAAIELASQSSMLGTAQERLNILKAKWRAAEVDYEATKQAALKAATSAHIARENASNAGGYARQKWQEAPVNSGDNLRSKHEPLSTRLYRRLH